MPAELSRVLTMVQEVLVVISAYWCSEALLEFLDQRELAGASTCLHAQFHKLRILHLHVRRYPPGIVFPRDLLRLSLSFPKAVCFNVGVLQPLFDQIFTSPISECTILCGRLTKSQWRILCRCIHHIGMRFDLRTRICIRIHSFRAHRQAPSRSPAAFEWVAQNAHLLHYVCSDLLLQTPDLELSSKWVLRELGVIAE